jgi:hypothetical protein
MRTTLARTIRYFRRQSDKSLPARKRNGIAVGRACKHLGLNEQSLRQIGAW